MKRILAVDDSASMRQMVGFTLKKAGFDGFLIGEYFMKSDSPNDLANKFINLVENEI